MNSRADAIPMMEEGLEDLVRGDDRGHGEGFLGRRARYAGAEEAEEEGGAVEEEVEVVAWNEMEETAGVGVRGGEFAEVGERGGGWRLWGGLCVVWIGGGFVAGRRPMIWSSLGWRRSDRIGRAWCCTIRLRARVSRSRYLLL